MRALRGIALTLPLAIALAAASVELERVGPAPAAWHAERCAPMPLHACAEGVLQGGWPAAFLLDQPGVSRMGQLAFVEDRFRPGAFVLDALLAWIALGAVVAAIRLGRSGRAPA
jgi:hypothetical protein